MVTQALPWQAMFLVVGDHWWVLATGRLVIVSLTQVRSIALAQMRHYSRENFVHGHMMTVQMMI